MSKLKTEINVVMQAVIAGAASATEAEKKAFADRSAQAMREIEAIAAANAAKKKAERWN